MKNWQIVEDLAAWNKLVEFTKYTGATPTLFPCLACLRISTDPATRIQMTSSRSTNLGQYLQVVTEADIKLFKDAEVKRDRAVGQNASFKVLYKKD